MADGERLDALGSKIVSQGGSRSTERSETWRPRLHDQEE